MCPFSFRFRILKSSKPASFSFSTKIINFILAALTNMILATIFIFFFLITTSSSWVEDDMQCLRDFKSSVSDPKGHLLSWNFSSGFICNFFGVSCWNARENRILSLSLYSSSLTGSIDSVLDSLRLCSSITSLDLSFNSFTGSIPATIPKSLAFLVQLDLSSNSLTGNIPPSLSDCTFLNSLDLSSNHLSGSIPALLSNLARLTSLDLSNNSLSGPVPVGLAKFGTARFRNNPSICGYPVSSACPKSPSQAKLSNIIIINLASGVFGFLLSLSISYVFTRLGFFPESLGLKKRTNRASSADNRMSGSARWSDHLRSSSHGGCIPVSLFRKPLVELTLADLMAATEGFHPDNIVNAGSSNLGTAFKAVLPDGSTLFVKRLQECLLTEHQFRVEMGRIGRICHPNLARLLGFCIAEEERLLIYKDAGNGALSSWLHAGDGNLDWPTRLRIATGVARGLAWLHHGFQVPLLHQKLNSSAILLDEDYEPRIADFGLARLTNTNLSVIASNPLPSTKGDVYEFGMVLLELATDRKAMEAFEDLATWVTNLYFADRILEAIDESLRGKGNDDEIVEFLKVACECVVARPHERPSMHDVYGSLKRIRSGLEILEQFDEPSVVCSKDELDATELVNLAYCMFTGENRL